MGSHGVSQRGLGVATPSLQGNLKLVLRHGLVNSVSRHTFWCHDTGERLGCHDTTSGVAIGKLHCGLKWGRDTLFGVATRSGSFGVTTHFLVSRHGLACLGSRPEIGVAPRPVHGRGTGVATRPLVL